MDEQPRSEPAETTAEHAPPAQPETGGGAEDGFDASPETEGPAQPTPGPAAAGAPDAAASPVAPRTQQETLRTLRAQWRDPQATPEGTYLVLYRTVGDDPNGIDPRDVRPRIRNLAAAFGHWEAAQLASDATRIGRLLRPEIGLLPAGRRWYAVRSFGRDAVAVTIGRPDPARALRDAELRYLAQVVEPRTTEPAEPGVAATEDAR